jgi:hypothetical protein
VFAPCERESNDFDDARDIEFIACNQRTGRVNDRSARVEDDRVLVQIDRLEWVHIDIDTFITPEPLELFEKIKEIAAVDPSKHETRSVRLLLNAYVHPRRLDFDKRLRAVPESDPLPARLIERNAVNLNVSEVHYLK